jgi:tetratricopeptide (TPR) repeat protein
MGAMKSFGKSLRNRLPAIGLGLIASFGIAAVMAPATTVAVAQANTSMEFGKPFQEAVALYQQRNWTGTLGKLDQASPHAKSQKERLGVEQLRYGVYVGQGNKAKQVSSLESQLTIGGLDANTVRNHKRTILGLYDDLGQTAKAQQLAKEYMASYGTDSQLLSFIASKELKAKNYAGAIDNANKAIAQAGKEGKRPPESLYKILMGAYFDSNNLPSYYTTVERMVASYPKDEYWNILIKRAEKAPKFNRRESEFDLMRARQAAKLRLSDADIMLMGELAFTKQSPVEAEALLKPLVASGALGGPKDGKAERNKRLFAQIEAAAKAARGGGLAAREAEALKAPTGLQLASVGETYFGMGDFAKAVDFIQKGVAKGQMRPEQLSRAQLMLGIAQYRAGKSEDARKTWEAIKADTGDQELARVWTLLSRT